MPHREGLSIALAIARGLQEPSGIKTYLNREQAGLYAQSFFVGYPGVAVLMSGLEQATAEQCWASAAHNLLRAATSERAQSISLGYGLSGILFAAQYISRGSRRYQVLRESLYNAITSALASYDILTVPPPTCGDYELLCGAAGVAVACNYAGAESDDASTRFLKKLVHAEEQSGWLTESRLGDDVRHGHNCGVAHGIMAALVALADRKLARDAVLRTADWVLRHRRKDDDGALLPGFISPQHVEYSRPGWCYGTPGIAAALFRVGQSLGSNILINSSVSLLKECMTPARGNLIDNGLCHGLAGVALIYHRVGTLARDDDLCQHSLTIKQDLIARYDADSPLGYRAAAVGGRLQDSPGFLEGSAGIACSLLTMDGLMDPAWTRALCIP